MDILGFLSPKKFLNWAASSPASWESSLDHIQRVDAEKYRRAAEVLESPNEIACMVGMLEDYQQLHRLSHNLHLLYANREPGDLPGLVHSLNMTLESIAENYALDEMELAEVLHGF